MNGIDYTFCDLRNKDVVNIADGKILGRIVDICLHCSGRVVGVVVPGDKKLFKNITGSDNIFVPWNNIIRIGNDVILVDLSVVNRVNNGNKLQT